MQVLRLLLLAFLLTACFSCNESQEASTDTPPKISTADHPNVLILYTDDQRYNTIHALNNPNIHTPNLDRLVNMGVAFTRAHTMGGMHGALCVPSRAMLMTGHSLFDLRSNGDYIPQEHVMMPPHLAAAGYKTFGTGKWHNGKKSYARAFQEGDNIYFGGMHFPKDGGHEAPWLHHFDETGKYPKAAGFSGEKFSSEMFADATIDFLGRQKGQDQPFCAYVSFSSPHDPRTPPAEFAAMYPPDSIPLPPNFLPEHPFDNGELKVRDEQLLPRPLTEKAVKEELAAYYGMISEVDAQIGRILDALEENGQLQNTLIVFAGDNGLAVGSHGLLGKQSLYEHSVRVPLIVAGPGIPQGEQRDALVYLADIFPTVCEVSRTEQPKGLYGKSLLPIMQDPKAETRSTIYYAYRFLMRGLRTADDWKLLAYHHKGTLRHQLFNLNDDPFETNNLAGNPRFADQLTRLQDLMSETSISHKDPVDLDSPTWGKGPMEMPTEVEHLAVGKKVTLKQPFSAKYLGIGPNGLIDGVLCISNFREDCWHAYEGEDLEAVIDLGKSTRISSISSSYYREIGSWIFFPLQVEYALSSDGKNFAVVGRVKNEAPTDEDTKGRKDMTLTMTAQQARYVRVRAKSQGTCPDWHSGAGGKAWLFVDEVVVK